MASAGSVQPTRTGLSDISPMRLAAGAGGGFLAGIVFIALVSWFDGLAGKDPLSPFKVIATLVQGPPPPMATIWIGMAIHSVLSALFGLGLAILTIPIVHNRLILLAGLLYGGVVYAVDFQVLARFIHQFSALLAGPNQALILSVHLVFGALTALFVMRSESTTARPPR